MNNMPRVVIAGMLANGLAWYDFTLYGYFAPLIGKLFFPGYDQNAQLIAAYGVFAAGFIMRPVGGMIFGFLGDDCGRKFSLTFAILVMAVSTALIGLLPVYESVGIIAPIMLTATRLLQGIALAGQYSGAMVFTVEHAPIGRRGLAGSSTVVSLCAGMLLASLSATIASTALSQSDFEDWGWRVPFLLGLSLAFVGIYIAYHTDETPHYARAKSEGRVTRTPLRKAIRGHIKEMLRGVGIYFAVTVPFYTLTVYMTGFMSHGLGLPLKDTYLINTISMMALVVILPFSAWFSDIVGRKLLLMCACVAYFLLSVPVFLVMEQGGFASVLIASIDFAIVTAFYISSVPALLVELFPTSIRYTAMALSYNIAAVLGGLTPMIETWLVAKTHLNIAVAAYIMLCAVISFCSFFGYHDSYQEELI